MRPTCLAPRCRHPSYPPRISAQLEIQGAEVAGVAMTPIMHVGIYLDSLIAIVIAALCATLVSGLYPAVSAGRVAPVESIRIV